MKHISTQAIVLSRTNFGEADRILTFLTLDNGKLRGLARGVRKQKSKLAGGIELFSVSEISFLIGWGEIYTITSTRLVKHYGNIVKDIDRTNVAYDFIKLLGKNTEDNLEPEYFGLLKNAFEALDDEAINLDLVQLWFKAQLLKLAGHTPNLRTNQNGQKLEAGKKYIFDFDSMGFTQSGSGARTFSADHIKLLRLVFGETQPKTLHKIQKSDKLALALLALVQTMLQSYMRV